MAVLEWDKLNERTYQSGVDRGVVYIDGIAVPWNGLISVQESEVNPNVLKTRFDGLTYFNTKVGGFFQANISAYTYPIELLKALGEPQVQPGFILTGQKKQRFDFTYRTMVNETDYKIHLVYNALITTTKRELKTINDTAEAYIYEWQIDCVPPERSDLHHPTAHMIVDSRTTPLDILESIENLLYGDEILDAQILPQIGIIGLYDRVWITLHDDGTWTAIAPDDSDKIVYLDDTTVEITYRHGVFLDEDTYQITANSS